MNRRNFLVSHSLLSGAAVTSLAGPAVAAASEGVVVVLPIIRESGKSDEELVRAFRSFADYMSRAPGFLEGTLLRATFKDTTFDYIDVTRWKARENWELLFASKSFLSLIESNSVFRVRPADIFVPVSM